MTQRFKAALYLRSSKDRADASPDAQREELTRYAKGKGHVIVAEYVDAAISANDSNRPQFGQMMLDAKARKFDVLLCTDSARLARDINLSGVIRYELAKCVRVEFSKQMNTGSAATDALLDGVMRSVDAFHSILSREKGRAGSIINVMKGHRAGGRAPLGYKLEHSGTGTMREGREVMKSRLVRDPEVAPLVKHFLELRALGVARHLAARQANLVRPSTTLLGIERNALTYAGVMTWNRHSVPKGGALKLNEREAWAMKEGTHEALIDQDTALRILEAAWPTGRRRATAISQNYLLVGMLATPDGRAWVGSDSGKFYRLRRGRRIAAPGLDARVLRQIRRELGSVAFAQAMRDECHRASAAQRAAPDAARKALAAVERKIGNLLALAESGKGAALSERLAELDSERARLRQEVESAAESQARAAMLNAVNLSNVRIKLDELALGLVDTGDVPELRATLAGIVDRIELPEDGSGGTIHYRIGVPAVRGAGVASPRSVEPGTIALAVPLEA